MRLACTGLPPLADRTASGEIGTIVTPSPLLAAAAAQQFSALQLSRHAETWLRPSIYSLDVWLTVCWQQKRYNSAAAPTLLSSSQELTLWREIIEHQNPALFDVSATANLARRAARILAEWKIPLDSALWNDHEDAQQFQRWIRAFHAKCAAENWITRADVLRLLPDWIRDGSCDPGDVIFRGFSTRIRRWRRFGGRSGLGRGWLDVRRLLGAHRARALVLRKGALRAGRSSCSRSFRAESGAVDWNFCSGSASQSKASRARVSERLLSIRIAALPNSVFHITRRGACTSIR